MAEFVQAPTPWAPSQFTGMKCACVHWSSRECAKARDPINPFDDPDEDETDERCDCCCHDRDEEDDTQYECWT